MRLGGIVLLVALSHCGRDVPNPGQLLVFVDTDAPVPGNKRPLFDTLIVEVTNPNGDVCKDCSRTFEVTADQFRNVSPPNLGVSIGIPARREGGWHVRLRLYDSHATLDGHPPDPLADGSPPPSVIDTTFKVYTSPEDGIVEYTAFLATDTVGIPGEGKFTDGRPTQSLVGKWPGVNDVPCAGAPNPEEVCIPGGAFWMGNPRVSGAADAIEADIRRLVLLSPYFIDRTEVTVEKYRAFASAVAWSGGTTGNDQADFCTFTASPGPHEDWPVNCVYRRDAQKYCQARGGDLPSEAQFEYVASDRRSALFVWGEDDKPTCEDAVLGRGGWGLFTGTRSQCKPMSPPGGALPVGSAANPRRDHATIGDDMVFDLVGNMDEWVVDLWNDQTEPCWNHGGVYVDPVCNQPSNTKWKFVGRGSSWYGFPANGAAAVRLPTERDVFGPDGGFRCARSAAP